MSECRLLVPDSGTCPHPALIDAADDDFYYVVSTLGRDSPRLKRVDCYEVFSGESGQASQWRQEAAIGEFLAAVARSSGISFAAAATDRYLRILYSVAGELGATFMVCGPSEAAFLCLSSKVRAREYFQRFGARVPAGRVVRTNHLESLDIDFAAPPFVVKLDQSVASSGVFLCKSMDDLRLALLKARLFNMDVVIEEFLGPTTELSHQFFVRHGEWLPAYSLRKLSHLGPSFSTCVEILDVPSEVELVRDFVQLFRSLDDGFYSAQLKEFADGNRALIEINCRLGNNFRILCRALPALGGAFLDFYCRPALWHFSYEKLRAQIRKRVAVRPIEEVLAALHRVRISASNRGPWKWGAELRHGLVTLASAPVIDYYLAKMVSEPAISLAYYRNVLSEVAHRKDRLASQCEMLER